MSNYSSTILPDLSPPRTFSIAFRPHVQPSIPETTPRQELPSIPLDNEMVDFEPGEINMYTTVYIYEGLNADYSQ